MTCVPCSVTNQFQIWFSLKFLLIPFISFQNLILRGKIPKGFLVPLKREGWDEPAMQLHQCYPDPIGPQIFLIGICPPTTAGRRRSSSFSGCTVVKWWHGRLPASQGKWEVTFVKSGAKKKKERTAMMEIMFQERLASQHIMVLSLSPPRSLL